MDFWISPDLDRQLRKIKSRNKNLIRKVEKQLLLFKENHLHPSLRLHKLSGSMENIWSISINNKIRMLFIQEDDGAYFFDIGTHDQVYQK